MKPSERINQIYDGLLVANVGAAEESFELRSSLMNLAHAIYLDEQREREERRWAVVRAVLLCGLNTCAPSARAVNDALKDAGIGMQLDQTPDSPLAAPRYWCGEIIVRAIREGLL